MKQAIQRLIICLIFLSGGLSAQTTYTWTGGNGSWSVPAKWIPAGVPGSQDTARIFNGTVTVNINVGVAKVLLAATGLNGDSTLTVTDSLIWRAGSPSGSGSIDIASGAVLLIEGDLNRTLSRTINNAGSAVWRGNNDIQFVLGALSTTCPAGFSKRITIAGFIPTGATAPVILTTRASSARPRAAARARSVGVRVSGSTMTAWWRCSAAPWGWEIISHPPTAAGLSMSPPGRSCALSAERTICWPVPR